MDASPIFLIGFMAAGKTTVGQLLARRLGRRFIDLDERVEAERGKTVAEIFRSEGEAVFRRHESAALAEAARERSVIIACGGGTPMFGANLACMRAAGPVVALLASFDDVLARVAAGGDGGRPLLAGATASPEGRASAERIYRDREAVYRSADICVDTSGRAPEVVCDELVRRAAARLGDVDVRLAERSYPLHLAPLARAGELLAELVPGVTRVALVSDQNVARAGHVDVVRQALKAQGRDVVEIVIPPGESEKKLTRVERVASACVTGGLDRRSLIMAVGGGVVGDLAGFVAATLFRGIACVQVPTTLLAMVDSSIGGKTGVDLPAGKNLLGAFWQPRFVLADVATLGTLPERERLAAHGEIVKYGLVGDRELFEALERGDKLDVSEVVLRCARQKTAIVRADEREDPSAPLSGGRMTLNLGHTVGHAIEAASLVGIGPARGALLHGEAVALGLVAAARLSARLGVCDPALASRVAGTLTRLGLDADAGAWLVRPVLAFLRSDKKRAANQIRFVAVEDVGRPRQIELGVNEVVDALLEEGKR